VRTELGRALRRAREAASLTRTDVAAQAGVTERDLAGYERGERAVTVVTLVDLAGIYGVSAVRLLNEAVRPLLQYLVVDAGLEGITGPERRIIGAFVEQVRSLRGLPEDAPVSIRHQDVEILASTVGMSAEELRAKIGTA
jgi:transcriptional regulator with XRE-family HTH domain